jgi:hypothetical protein
VNGCRGLSLADRQQQPAGLLGRDGNDLHAKSLGLLVQTSKSPPASGSGLRYASQGAREAGADQLLATFHPTFRVAHLALLI